ncbi:hypothetical protein ABIB51_004337 [Arthrobacter sp. UYCu712]
MPSPIIGRPVSDHVWESIRSEYTPPSLEQVRRQLAELMEDTDPVMRQLVRVFIGEGTYCLVSASVLMATDRSRECPHCCENSLLRCWLQRRWFSGSTERTPG